MCFSLCAAIVTRAQTDAYGRSDLHKRHADPRLVSRKAGRSPAVRSFQIGEGRVRDAGHPQLCPRGQTECAPCRVSQSFPMVSTPESRHVGVGCAPEAWQNAKGTRRGWHRLPEGPALQVWRNVLLRGMYQSTCRGARRLTAMVPQCETAVFTKRFSSPSAPIIPFVFLPGTQLPDLSVISKNGLLATSAQWPTSIGEMAGSFRTDNTRVYSRCRPRT